MSEGINHIYVPKHEKLSPEQAQEVLKTYNIMPKQLPVINAKDAAIRHLNPEKGDIIKIYRPSPTRGEAIFYRIVA